MFDALRRSLLTWMRVPPEPEPPAGSPDSIRVFRAGPNLYKLRLIRWGVIQWALFVALIAFIGVAASIERNPRVPEWLVFLLGIGQSALVAIFLFQALVTYAAVRLNYEMRWYIVTDRSLRIRTGIWSVEELTMTFANIQQVNLRQGPLQRLLGIADLVVTSAGGKVSKTSDGKLNSNAGRFEGVDNADAIRDLILERLKHYRDAGLGDPDERHSSPGAVPAAQELLAEAQALRALLTH